MRLEIDDIAEELFELMPDHMPHVEEITTVSTGYRGYAWASEHGALSYGVGTDGRLLVSHDLPSYGAATAIVERTDEEGFLRFLSAAGVYAGLAYDPWEDADDVHVVGTESWEDQRGMAQLKRRLEIPDDWFLVKVVNFGSAGRTLEEIAAWLKEHMMGEYKRVGWYSSCSTKVGVAFKDQNDAFFYIMRWR